AIITAMTIIRTSPLRQKEQPDEERYRAAPVGLDVAVETIGGHRELLLVRGLEFHGRRFAYGCVLVAEIEECLRSEAESRREQSRGEALVSGIVFLDGIVEEPPRSGDLVLQVGELCL